MSTYVGAIALIANEEFTIESVISTIIYDDFVFRINEIRVNLKFQAQNRDILLLLISV